MPKITFMNKKARQWFLGDASETSAVPGMDLDAQCEAQIVSKLVSLFGSKIAEIKTSDIVSGL